MRCVGSDLGPQSRQPLRHVQHVVGSCEAFESALADFTVDLSAKSLEVLPNRRKEESSTPPRIRAGPLDMVQVLPLLCVSLDHERSTQVRGRLHQATKTWGKWRHLLATRGQFRIHQLCPIVVASAMCGTP